MKLEFDSIEEVKEFVTKLKGTRGGKGDKEDEAPQGQAPAPLAPPTNQTGAAAFNQNPAPSFAPPVPGATAAVAGPFASAATGPAPEVLALVNRIVVRLEGAIASGQPADQALAWLRSQCGPDAANATMDQMKTVVLPKASVPVLENIAKLMNA